MLSRKCDYARNTICGKRNIYSQNGNQVYLNLLQFTFTVCNSFLLKIQILNLFKKHKTSTVFLLLYIVWWIFVWRWFSSDSSAYPNSCGAANGGLLMLTILISVIYFIILLIKTAISKEEKRWDYLFFLGIVFFSSIVGFSISFR